MLYYLGQPETAMRRRETPTPRSLDPSSLRHCQERPITNMTKRRCHKISALVTFDPNSPNAVFLGRSVPARPPCTAACTTSPSVRVCAARGAFDHLSAPLSVLGLLAYASRESPGKDCDVFNGRSFRCVVLTAAAAAIWLTGGACPVASDLCVRRRLESPHLVGHRGLKVR